MRATLHWICLAAVCLALWSTGCATTGNPAADKPDQKAVTPGSPAPQFSLADTHGKRHALSDYRGKFVVLEWINFDCPFVRKHYDTGNMQSLQKKYTGKGAIWLSVNSSAPGKQGHYPPERVNELLKEKGAAPVAYLIDSDGQVGTAYGAKTTPHMFIIDPKGILIYAGAVDDKPTTDKEDIKGATNYVQSALDEALSGKPVSVASTKSYGCSVKY
ncbi:MAG TPA: thioredoxin family protein [Candidatus Obscuribacterales bacterium]